MTSRQGGRRLDAQLVAETAPEVVVGAQRLRSSPGGGERDHQQLVRALPQRVLVGERRKVSQRVDGPAAVDHRCGPLLDRPHPPLLEPLELGSSCVHVGELGVRRTVVPTGQRVVEQRHRRRRIGRPHGLRLDDGGHDRVGVDVDACGIQLVPGAR